MKIVNINGQVYQVTNEAQFIAMDADGDWYWYVEKPWILDEHAEWDNDGGKSEFICQQTPYWEDSLREIQ